MNIWRSILSARRARAQRRARAAACSGCPIVHRCGERPSNNCVARREAVALAGGERGNGSADGCGVPQYLRWY